MLRGSRNKGQAIASMQSLLRISWEEGNARNRQKGLRELSISMLGDCESGPSKVAEMTKGSAMDCTVRLRALALPSCDWRGGMEEEEAVRAGLG